MISATQNGQHAFYKRLSCNMMLPAIVASGSIKLRRRLSVKARLPRMIVTQSQSRAGDVHFVIRPNQSLSWRGNQLFLAGMVAVSFSIAGVFAAQGIWMVLPFAGFEMLVLALALHQCCVRTCQQEVVSIAGSEVQVAVGREKPERSFTFKRCWARVIIDQAKTRGYPSRLLIRSHGRQIEIGACLIDDERQTLAAALRRAL
jgi:uncharacterized membrane protein